MEKKPLTNAFADLIKWITGSKSLGWPVGDDQPSEKKKPSGKIIIVQASRRRDGIFIGLKGQTGGGSSAVWLG